MKKEEKKIEDKKIEKADDKVVKPAKITEFEEKII